MAHPPCGRGVDALGMRRPLGQWGWDVDDGPLAAPAAEVLARSATCSTPTPTRRSGGGWVTLVGHDLMSDELVAGASELARERGPGSRSTSRPTPATRVYLARTGRCARSSTSTASACSGRTCSSPTRCTSTTTRSSVVLRHRSAIASCPWAYLRLAQGVTTGGRHVEFGARGGRVALGCDAENAGRRRRRAARWRRCSSAWRATGPATRRRSPPRRARPRHLGGRGGGRPGRPDRVAGGRSSRPTSWCTTHPGRSGCRGAPTRYGSSSGRPTGAPCGRGRRRPGRRRRRTVRHGRPRRAARRGPTGRDFLLPDGRPLR